ncbi:MAG: M48 family metallopeptidase [Lachnospiraceae bacterium]|nr:M48 family metallopeptidase [Lachnospiraceae bacterium]
MIRRICRGIPCRPVNGRKSGNNRKKILDYRIEVIKSRRKSLSMRIKDEETVLVQAPLYATKKDIDAFVHKHARWIEIHIRKTHEKEEYLKRLPKLSETELKHLVADAKRQIPKRVAYYAPLVGTGYGRITIRKQKSRWGSCTTDGNLSFNALLMLTPPEVLDSVVVHELCHRLEMNHSEAFYQNVYRVFPEYDKWNKWLKDNGDLLIARLPKQGK